MYELNPSRFFFLVQIRAFVIHTSLGLPNLNEKQNLKRILVVAVKWRHHANCVLPSHKNLLVTNNQLGLVFRCPLLMVVHIASCLTLLGSVIPVPVLTDLYCPGTVIYPGVFFVFNGYLLPGFYCCSSYRFFLQQLQKIK